MTDDEAMEAFRLLNSSEGILPALEVSHAIGLGHEAAAGHGRRRHRGGQPVGRGDKDILTVARMDGIDL